MAESLPPEGTPHLHGVWAKWERAAEQLKALNEEVLAFGRRPHAWTIRSYADRERMHYVFRLDPAWKPSTVLRWGSIVGEILHDFRSSLDQLVSQLVALNGGTPTVDHFFPIWSQEPREGFTHAARRQLKDRRGRDRHGPLFGVSAQAMAIIEACQPYNGGHVLLARLHQLWNIDKHQQLVPMHMVAQGPSLKLTNAVVIDRVPDRFEGSTYVVEVTIMESETGLDPRVDVKPHTPSDIAFGDGRAVINDLVETGKLLIGDILEPLGDLFPGCRGVGLP